MTVFFKSVHRAIIHFISLILFPIVLMACSGGETGTGFDKASDTTITVGRITEFGSVYVNDIEFDTTNSTVSDCYAMGAVTGRNNVGGLVGYNHSGTTVSNSYATGTASGQSDVGGLTGADDFETTVTN